MGKYEEASGGRHFNFSGKAGNFLPDSTYSILPTDIYFLVVMFQMAQFFYAKDTREGLPYS